MVLTLYINSVAKGRIDSFEVRKIVTNGMGEFKIVVIDTDGTLFSSLAYKDDIKLERNGTTIIRGFLERFSKQENKIILLEGRDYSALVFSRLVTKTYSSQTASQIVQDLITNYVPELTATNVQATSFVYSTFTIQGESVASAIKRLAKSEGYTWYVDENKDLHFEPEGYSDSGKTLIYGTTAGFIGYEFPSDGTRMKNVIHVFGKPKQPDGSGGIYIVRRDGDSVAKYGAIEYEIRDPSIETIDEAIQRADYELRKTKNPIERGVVKLLGYEDLKPGQIVRVTVASEGISNAQYLIIATKHYFSPFTTVLEMAELSMSVADILAQEIERLSSVDARDRDSSVTPTKLEDVLETVAVSATLTIERRTVSGASLIETNFLIESAKIENLVQTNFEQVGVYSMTIVDTGLNLIRDRFANLTPPTEPNAIAVGDNNTPVQQTDTALGNEIARKALDAGYPQATATAGEVKYVSTLLASEGVGTLREVGLFNSTTGGSGTMIARAVIADLVKSSSEELRLTITIKFENK